MNFMLWITLYIIFCVAFGVASAVKLIIAYPLAGWGRAASTFIVNTLFAPFVLLVHLIIKVLR
jgi:hypothetical protein